MEKKEFKAFVVEEHMGTFKGSIQSKIISDLPKGEVLIHVHYSSLNYKDALSAKGNKGVTKNYPHTPGIDAAGIVVSSETIRFRPLDKVIVTGYDLGMNTHGGFGEYIRVPEQWVVELPPQLSLKEAMVFGTAGFTAALSVQKLLQNITPEDGPIAVSGATGGVGSLSILILKKLNFNITAITSKEKEYDYLKQLGADNVIFRKDVEALGQQPLLKPIFAGAVDSVGGMILQNIIKSTQPTGIVTCCGNAAGSNLNLSVYPFILRGITLTGIDSQHHPIKDRRNVWNLLSNDWKPEELSFALNEIYLSQLNDKIKLMLDGALTGRTVVCLI